MKIVTIVGARPQFVKASVVSRAIDRYNGQVSPPDTVSEIILHTGQHFDRNMSDVFFEEMEIPKPAYHLNIHSLSHGAMTGQMLEKIEEVLASEQPDRVLVYGDTNSTIAGALAAAKLHIPVAHVEAGLRSFNRRMPEEINRVLTDHLSTWLFCPTQYACDNLNAEGIGNHAQVTISSASRKYDQKIRLVGDVMFDAALFYSERSASKSVILNELKRKHLIGDSHFVLCTIHRAENTDFPERLGEIFAGISKIADRIPVILPLHPRTRQKIDKLNISERKNPNIIFLEPVGYFDMIELLTHCSMVMTDSGGVQKEAFFFQKPCVTLRDETEWVELLEYGYNHLTECRREQIYAAYETMIKRLIPSDHRLYGDGHAGEMIVRSITGHDIS